MGSSGFAAGSAVSLWLTVSFTNLPRLSLVERYKWVGEASLTALAGLQSRSCPLPTDFMIDYSEKNGRLTFNVRVVPRASRSEIVGEHDGALRVRVSAAPVDGAANEELVRMLARVLHVPRNSVEIIAGQTSKLKQVTVSGATSEQLFALGPTRASEP